MKELERLQHLALNVQHQEIKANTLIQTLNIRSLQKHHKNLSKDPLIGARVIALQETWCSPDQGHQDLALPHYQVHFASKGRGKGVATFFKPEFQVTGSIIKDFYQISKVSSAEVDVINVYCSQGFNKTSFLKDLGALASGRKQCFIVGDFNINFLSQNEDLVIKKIISSGFKQIVTLPTHIAGSLLDHVYIRNSAVEYKIEVNFPFYSDHAAISIIQ